MTETHLTNMKDEQQQIDIAVIQSDIKYMKSDITEIKNSTKGLELQLKTMLEHYITRQEVHDRFERMQEEIDSRFAGAHKRIDLNATKEEIEPFKKIFWAIVTALSIAVLFAIVKLLP